MKINKTWQFQKGNPPLLHKKGCKCFRCSGVAWNKGIKRWWKSPTEFKKGTTPKNFKGDKVGYCALHDWVGRRFGKARVCIICGEKTGRIEWANISLEYKRNLDDWMSLCSKCHRKYDRINGWGKASSKFPEIRRYR